MFGNCILLVCGLPATGKSTLVKYLLNHFNNQPVPYNVIPVFYDQLIPLDAQKEMIKEQDAWRRSRQEILEATELLLRKRMVLEMEKSVAQNPYYERLLEMRNEISGCTSGCGNLVMVEDNLYYSSMRYSWYQLARKLSFGFCQVWLECPLLVLKGRNESREFSVPWEVIQTMSLREEAPNPEKNSWEFRSLRAPTHLSSTSELVKKVLDLIMAAVADPLTPLQSPEDAKPSEALTPSIAHQVDQILRKCVASKINEAKGKASSLSLYAKQVNCTRQVVLDRLRRCEIQIPTSLDEEPEKLEKYVITLFASELNSCQYAI